MQASDGRVLACDHHLAGKVMGLERSDDPTPDTVVGR
jgi:hypothetical protein